MELMRSAPSAFTTGGFLNPPLVLGRWGSSSSSSGVIWRRDVVQPKRRRMPWVVMCVADDEHGDNNNRPVVDGEEYLPWVPRDDPNDPGTSVAARGSNSRLAGVVEGMKAMQLGLEEATKEYRRAVEDLGASQQAVAAAAMNLAVAQQKAFEASRAVLGVSDDGFPPGDYINVDAVGDSTIAGLATAAAGGGVTFGAGPLVELPSPRDAASPLTTPVGNPPPAGDGEKEEVEEVAEDTSADTPEEEAVVERSSAAGEPPAETGTKDEGVGAEEDNVAAGDPDKRSVEEGAKEPVAAAAVEKAGEVSGSMEQPADEASEERVAEEGEPPVEVAEVEKDDLPEAKAKVDDIAAPAPLPAEADEPAAAAVDKAGDAGSSAEPPAEGVSVTGKGAETKEEGEPEGVGAKKGDTAVEAPEVPHVEEETVKAPKADARKEVDSPAPSERGSPAGAAAENYNPQAEAPKAEVDEVSAAEEVPETPPLEVKAPADEDVAVDQAGYVDGSVVSVGESSADAVVEKDGQPEKEEQQKQKVDSPVKAEAQNVAAETAPDTPLAEAEETADNEVVVNTGAKQERDDAMPSADATAQTKDESGDTDKAAKKSIPAEAAAEARVENEVPTPDGGSAEPPAEKDEGGKAVGDAVDASAGLPGDKQEVEVSPAEAGPPAAEESAAGASKPKKSSFDRDEPPSWKKPKAPKAEPVEEAKADNVAAEALVESKDEKKDDPPAEAEVKAEPAEVKEEKEDESSAGAEVKSDPVAVKGERKDEQPETAEAKAEDVAAEAPDAPPAEVKEDKEEHLEGEEAKAEPVDAEEERKVSQPTAAEVTAEDVPAEVPDAPPAEVKEAKKEEQPEEVEDKAIQLEKEESDKHPDGEEAKAEPADVEEERKVAQPAAAEVTAEDVTAEAPDAPPAEMKKEKKEEKLEEVEDKAEPVDVKENNKDDPSMEAKVKADPVEVKEERKDEQPETAKPEAEDAAAEAPDAPPAEVKEEKKEEHPEEEEAKAKPVDAEEERKVVQPAAAEVTAEEIPAEAPDAPPAEVKEAKKKEKPGEAELKAGPVEVKEESQDEKPVEAEVTAEDVTAEAPDAPPIEVEEVARDEQPVGAEGKGASVEVEEDEMTEQPEDTKVKAGDVPAEAPDTPRAEVEKPTKGFFGDLTQTPSREAEVEKPTKGFFGDLTKPPVRVQEEVPASTAPPPDESATSTDQVKPSETADVLDDVNAAPPKGNTAPSTDSTEEAAEVKDEGSEPALDAVDAGANSLSDKPDEEAPLPDAGLAVADESSAEASKPKKKSFYDRDELPSWKKPKSTKIEVAEGVAAEPAGEAGISTPTEKGDVSVDKGAEEGAKVVEEEAEEHDFADVPPVEVKEPVEEAEVVECAEVDSSTPAAEDTSADTEAKEDEKSTQVEAKADDRLVEAEAQANDPVVEAPETPPEEAEEAAEDTQVEQAAEVEGSLPGAGANSADTEAEEIDRPAEVEADADISPVGAEEKADDTLAEAPGVPMKEAEEPIKEAVVEAAAEVENSTPAEEDTSADAQADEDEKPVEVDAKANDPLVDAEVTAEDTTAGVPGMPPANAEEPSDEVKAEEAIEVDSSTAGAEDTPAPTEAEDKKSEEVKDGADTSLTRVPDAPPEEAKDPVEEEFEVEEATEVDSSVPAAEDTSAATDVFEEAKPAEVEAKADAPAAESEEKADDAADEVQETHPTETREAAEAAQVEETVEMESSASEAKDISVAPEDADDEKPAEVEPRADDLPAEAERTTDDHVAEAPNTSLEEAQEPAQDAEVDEALEVDTSTSTAEYTSAATESEEDDKSAEVAAADDHPAAEEAAVADESATDAPETLSVQERKPAEEVEAQQAVEAENLTSSAVEDIPADAKVEKDETPEEAGATEGDVEKPRAGFFGDLTKPPIRAKEEEAPPADAAPPAAEEPAAQASKPRKSFFDRDEPPSWKKPKAPNAEQQEPPADASAAEVPAAGDDVLLPSSDPVNTVVAPSVEVQHEQLAEAEVKTGDDAATMAVETASAEAEKPKQGFFGDLTKPPVRAREETPDAAVTEEDEPSEAAGDASTGVDVVSVGGESNSSEAAPDVKVEGGDDPIAPEPAETPPSEASRTVTALDDPLQETAQESSVLGVLGTTIADVSSPVLSDSLRVVIGDIVATEAPETTTPGAEKKPRKGIFVSLLGLNKAKPEVSDVDTAAPTKPTEPSESAPRASVPPVRVPKTNPPRVNGEHADREASARGSTSGSRREGAGAAKVSVGAVFSNTMRPVGDHVPSADAAAEGTTRKEKAAQRLMRLLLASEAEAERAAKETAAYRAHPYLRRQWVAAPEIFDDAIEYRKSAEEITDAFQRGADVNAVIKLIEDDKTKAEAAHKAEGKPGERPILGSIHRKAAIRNSVLLGNIKSMEGLDLLSGGSSSVP